MGYLPITEMYLSWSRNYLNFQVNTLSCIQNDEIHQLKYFFLTLYLSYIYAISLAAVLPLHFYQLHEY